MRTGRSRLSTLRFEKRSTILSSHNCQRNTPSTSSCVSALSAGLSLGSSAARRTDENAPSATRRRISNAARRAGETSFCLAKTIANLYVYAVHEVADTHPLSRFRLHFEQTQRSVLAAVYNQIAVLNMNHLTGRRHEIRYV